MTTYALVHGAWHDSRCWSWLAAELRAAGGRTVAVDLPIEDPTAGALRYAEVVESGLSDVDDEVVLVGHSLAGLTIPLVAERRAVSRLVLVCAFVPEPGRSMVEVARERRAMAATWRTDTSGLLRRRDGSTAWPPAAAVSTLYHDCPPAVAATATGWLRRQQWTVFTEPSPLTGPPTVPVSSIVATGDRLVDPGYQRAAAARLGVTPVEVAGGHFPMLSRPEQLARLLLACGR